jgi:hypothetical protein
MEEAIIAENSSWYELEVVWLSCGTGQKHVTSKHSVPILAESRLLPINASSCARESCLACPSECMEAYVNAN